MDAFLAAIKSFAGQIKKLADYGLPTIDSACLSSAQDYLATNQVSSSPLMSAMEAFVQKAVQIDVGYDPVCYAAADKFIESYISGKREDVSLQIAAKEFLSLYFANPSVANRSPCAAAAKAYAGAASNDPNSTINRAMLAFIEEAEEKNHSGVDPVCSATGEAYFNAFLAGATEGAATKAAAIAFIEAVGSNPTFQLNSPCGKAAEVYIAQVLLFSRTERQGVQTDASSTEAPAEPITVSVAETEVVTTEAPAEPTFVVDETEEEVQPDLTETETSPREAPGLPNEEKPKYKIVRVRKPLGHSVKAFKGKIWRNIAKRGGELGGSEEPVVGLQR